MTIQFLDVGGESYEDLALNRDLVHMGHNCNLLPLHPAIHEAMVEAIRADAWRVYAPPMGFAELRELIRDDVGVAGADVMVTQGATEAIYQAMATLLKPGDQAIMSDPGWPHIANFARALGAEAVELPVYSPNARYKLLPELVRDAVTPRTRLIAVIDPLNPLGSGYTEREIQELCAIAEGCGAYLLHDSTYRNFAADGHFPAIRYSKRAVMNVSLSKIAGFAGLRIGATLADPELVKRIAEWQVSRLGANWVSQRGAIAAYRTKGEWLPKVVETSRRHLAELNSAIEAVEGLRVLVYPSSGNFLAADVTGTGLGSEDVVRAVLEEGYVIRSGNYTSKRFGNKFVRVTATVPAEAVAGFAKALPKAIAKARAKK